MANLEDINLECRNPSGWTPLQESLLYVVIQLLREKHSFVDTTFQGWLYEASEEVFLGFRGSGKIAEKDA